MFGLNYENVNKFHMSLGIALIFTSSILFMGNYWLVYDKQVDLEKFSNFCTGVKQTDSQYQLILARLEYIKNGIYITNYYFLTTSIIGSLFFIVGYTPYLYKHLKK